MSTSIRALFRHAEPYPVIPGAVRTILRKPAGRLRVSVVDAPLSVMCQNMGLLVFPAPYLGTDRRGAIDALVHRVVERAPDIVGLCEVFVDAERAEIVQRLKLLFPYSTEGPDADLIRSDGGLLLLSKFPFLQAPHRTVYRAATSWDQLARKGVIHVRLRAPASPATFDIFFTHAQDIEAPGGREALYAQLNELNEIIERRADPQSPTLIIGDLNVPGEVPQHYSTLLDRLRKPVDLWVVDGNPEDSGYTFAVDNNFYANAQDTPRVNHRLDYVLMRAGSRWVPMLDTIEILRLQHGGRAISDHYGLAASFKAAVLLES